MNHFNRHALAAIDLLESWGIDPYEVLRDGISQDGYLVRRKDAFGNTKMNDTGDGFILDWMEWPSGFPTEVFLGCVQKWRETER